MPVRQAFGSPGGKSNLAKKINSLVPKHTTYVEPFAGGAAVFWNKEPSTREVLNDKDPEIAFAYRFIKGMTDTEFKSLKRMQWVHGEGTFERIKGSKPRGRVERFRKFYYLGAASWGGGKQQFRTTTGMKIDIDKLVRCKARLKGVTVLSKDYKAVISAYNSPATFFYVDPPYPGTAFLGAKDAFTEKHLQELIAQLKRVKGKFILSLDSKHSGMLPKSWHIRRAKVHSNIGGTEDYNPSHRRYEILVANFQI